jgi:hypothetical protein
VLSNPLRAAVLTGVLSLIAVAGSAGSASALPETSQITSPASPTYALNDETLSPPQVAFTVEGTTNISGKVSVRCYFGTGTTKTSYNTFAEEVTPSAEKFSVEVKAASLHDGPCVLRAVPLGNEEAHPPGTPAEEAGDPFKGPRIVGSRFELFPSVNNHYDYEIEPSSLSAYFDLNSVGNCGVNFSYLYAPEKLTTSEPLFFCNAALGRREQLASGSPTRSALQIDGANAYSPDAAHSVEADLNVKALLPGAPQVTVTKTFEPSTGLVTVKEVDPIVKCFPQAVYPPTLTSCTSFVSTGVQLERTWQTINANQVASMTDVWSSTDGVPHALNALYEQETANEGKEGGAYQFPGTNVFAATSKGETVSLPPGLGRIYYKEEATTPSEGDGTHPQGAIVYDTPPSGPLSVYLESSANKEGFNGFEMPYQGTIPAGGAYTLRMAFIQAYKLPEVEALASEVLAKYPPSSPPTLSITSPTSGSTVSTPSVTVSGTVTDTRVITSLTVAGKAVSMGAGGAWSTSVPLMKGANTIKALATDQAGFSTEKSVSVTYTPVSPMAHAKQVGSASGANGQVRFTVLCTGTVGTSCEIEATLTTLEKTRNGRLIAVLARRHHGTHSTRVTVGSSKLTIPAGQRVTIEIQLNATGQSLLAQFGKLPVHLTVVQISAGHRSTVIAENLNVTSHRRHRRHHHHHHHRH